MNTTVFMNMNMNSPFFNYSSHEYCRSVIIQVMNTIDRSYSYSTHIIQLIEGGNHGVKMGIFCHFLKKNEEFSENFRNFLKFIKISEIFGGKMDGLEETLNIARVVTSMYNNNMQHHASCVDLWTCKRGFRTVFRFGPPICFYSSNIHEFE